MAVVSQKNTAAAPGVSVHAACVQNQMQFVAGEHVEVFSESKGVWITGEVLSVSSSATVTVRYDAGRLQKTLAPSQMGLLRRSPGNGMQLPQAKVNVASDVPVIFLDVDGVLHSLYGDEVFAGSCCAALEKLVRASGARVVLSNSWARDGEERAGMVDALLRRHGLAGLLGTVADGDPEGGGRPENDIAKWLDANPGVRNWVVFDDADLEVAPSASASRMRGRCVRPDKHVGLTDADAEEAISLLVRGDCGGCQVAPARKALTQDELARAKLSKEAEARHWEDLRNGGFAEMEAAFFGDEEDEEP